MRKFPIIDGNSVEVFVAVKYFCEMNATRGLEKMYSEFRCAIISLKQLLGLLIVIQTDTRNRG